MAPIKKKKTKKGSLSKTRVIKPNSDAKPDKVGANREKAVISYFKKTPTTMKEAVEKLGMTNANVRYYLKKNNMLDLVVPSDYKGFQKDPNKLDDEILLPQGHSKSLTTITCPVCTKRLVARAKSATLVEGKYRKNFFATCKCGCTMNFNKVGLGD